MISCFCFGVIETAIVLAAGALAAVADCACRHWNARECFRLRYPKDDTGDCCECACHDVDSEDSE